jgi:hypothetical protein
VPQRAVMIHLGETEVLERQVAHPFERLIDSDFSAPHLLEQCAEKGLIHASAYQTP